MPDIDIHIADDERGLTQPPASQEPTTSDAGKGLDLRKTLDGSFIIADHSDIDIVVMPQMFKVVTFPKDEFGDHIYASQSRLFDFLKKKGVIVIDSVQSGNLYGSLEANIPPAVDPDVDPIEIVISVIKQFIEEERPFYNREERYKDDVEKWLLEPDDDISTDLDWAAKTHQPRKGVQNRWPGSSAAYGLTGMYRA